MRHCPCGTGKSYDECCELYHKKVKLPENALLLMRSRYSAYALHLALYIMETTHPSNDQYQKDRQKWSREILKFSQSTSFLGLDILEFEDGTESATVTFKAHLSQKGQDVSFQEKSLFEKVDGQWLYKSSLIII